jgi:tryptophan-rich sensory protein
MGDVFWGLVFVAVGITWIASRRAFLREMQRWYERSRRSRWRPPLWTWGVVLWVGGVAWIAWGIAFIVEG